MADRILLPQGYKLQADTRIYQIEQYISAGSNAIVYQASYRDTLMPEHFHTVLIKELYPLEPSGLITRDESMGLVIPEKALDFFQYHKQSFLLGNQAHLTISEDGGGHLAENLDSFEANRTFYTVLSSRKGRVLSELMNDGTAFSSLTEVALMLQSLLRALQPFHSHQLLHLDISPDNIFVLAPDGAEKVSTDIILLDFNSVYSLDRRSLPEGDYYLGKPAYTAPEITLHEEASLGPWTDLYSVAAVFYELLTGEALPLDRELLDTSGLISPYVGLLLHEKECSAMLVNAILDKGLQILPDRRYQDVAAMMGDVKKLLGVLSGAITDYTPFIVPPVNKRVKLRKKMTVAAAVFVVLAGGLTLYFHSPLAPNRQPVGKTVLDLTKIPLEKDDSIVITQANVGSPLKDNILKLNVQDQVSVSVNLKDFTHTRDVSKAFMSYTIFPVYSGEGDRRGMQNNGQIYDFFRSPDNSVHMELALVDENNFDLKIVGLVFSDWNYKDIKVLLDVKRFTLIDGKGESHEITELTGSHILHFGEDIDTWYLVTFQMLDYVKTFEDIRGGQIIVDAELNELEPLLEVTWESDRPDVATVDQNGTITSVSAGQAKITVTIRDKATGDVRKTQILADTTDLF